MMNRNPPIQDDQEAGRQQDQQAQSNPAAGPGSSGRARMSSGNQRNVGRPQPGQQRAGTSSTPSPNQSGSMGSTRRDDTKR